MGPPARGEDDEHQNREDTVDADEVWSELMDAAAERAKGARTILLANTEEAMDEFLRAHGIRLFKKMDKRGTIQRIVREQGNRVMYQNASSILPPAIPSSVSVPKNPKPSSVPAPKIPKNPKNPKK